MKRIVNPLEPGSFADFSDCERYRFHLERRWSRDGPLAVFVMLNPSTADAFKLDPTVRKCIRFARFWKMSGVHVVNIFAWRSTDPSVLPDIDEPTGGEANDVAILRACTDNPQRIVLGWGIWGELSSRGRQVQNLLDRHVTHAFGFTKNNQPKHPLYLRGTSELQVITEG